MDEWLDFAELEVQKQGPALRNRLDGVAATYKPLFDRAKLKEADGVDYFKKFLRPHFVKGAHNVFLWRLFQLFKAARGSQDILQWIARIQVLRKGVTEAWGNIHNPTDRTNLVDVNHLNNEIAAERQRQQVQWDADHPADGNPQPGFPGWIPDQAWLDTPITDTVNS
jgi:hypothetical protein